MAGIRFQQEREVIGNEQRWKMGGIDDGQAAEGCAGKTSMIGRIQVLSRLPES
jgi:hypothetical protein